MQPLPEPLVQGIEIDRLAVPVVAVAGSPLGTAPCVACMDPVGCLVAGAGEPGGVHEGLGQPQRDVVEVEPVP